MGPGLRGPGRVEAVAFSFGARIFFSLPNLRFYFWGKMGPNLSEDLFCSSPNFWEKMGPILCEDLFFALHLILGARHQSSYPLEKFLSEALPIRLQLIICHKKELLSSHSSIKLVVIRNKCYQCKLVCISTMNNWCKILTIKTLTEVNRT